MPSEQERYGTTAWDQAVRRAAEQFARDQVELSHARDHVESREITDEERDQLRAAKAAAAAMPSERIWEILERSNGDRLVGHSFTHEPSARRQAELMNDASSTLVYEPVEYVRKDVADAEAARLRAAIRTYLASEYYDDYRDRLRSPEFEVDQPAADLLAACSEGDNA